MEKTSILNETQMKLLKEFIDAQKRSEQARIKFDGMTGSASYSGDRLAAYDAAAKEFCQADDKSYSAARRFAYSVAEEFVAEQGPRVNPEGTADDAGTPA